MPGCRSRSLQQNSRGFPFPDPFSPRTGYCGLGPAGESTSRISEYTEKFMETAASNHLYPGQVEISGQTAKKVLGKDQPGY